MPVGPAGGLCLALVGARASTRYGEGVATSLASGVTAKGGLIVSGGAFGIDACAHRGALQEGPTVSVSAGGVDRLYPVGNTGVLEAVISNGALVAEVPPAASPAATGSSPATVSSRPYPGRRSWSRRPGAQEPCPPPTEPSIWADRWAPSPDR